MAILRLIYAPFPYVNEYISVSNDIIVTVHVLPCVLYVGMDVKQPTPNSRVKADDNIKHGDRGRDNDNGPEATLVRQTIKNHVDF